MQTLTLIASLLSLLIAACTTPEPLTQNHITTESDSLYAEAQAELLSWVDDADPIKDAKAALTQGNQKLWSIDNRAGSRIVGLSIEESKKWARRNGIMSGEGLSDVIYGSRHLQRRIKFDRYAKRYNQYIIEHSK